MKHQWKLYISLAIGVVSLILQFGFHLNNWAQILITVAGSIMALSMTIEMIRTLKSGKYGVDALAIMAIVATMAVGEYWASWMILIMLTGGDTLEDYAAAQAGKELKALLENSPQVAHKVTENGTLIDVPVDDIQVNDQVVVKPGGVVPVDGVIVEGSSSFDESTLTGESVPVDKTVDDKLMSGSINGSSSITMKVLKIAADSQYQAIVHLVKSSETQPAKFVRMADQYAVPFTIIALIIAGVAWAVTGDPVRFAEVLVVASPCPLILAAPVALVAGMSRMSKNNIVVKSGTTIEKLAKVKTFAFDKTGTLTKNQLTINKIHPVAGFDEKTLQVLAASAEQESGHIIARSLVANTKHSDLLEMSDLNEVTGSGIQAQVDGKTIKVGKLAFVAPEQEKIQVDQTAIYVSIDGQFAGYIIFADQIRPESAGTIDELRNQGINHIMMLTGDHEAIARKVADQVGVDDVRFDCLPEQKIHYIKDVEKDLHPVAMVGDGVNDAPSLAVADVGIAMGATGATAASESADAVILVDDLSRVNTAVEISKRTMNIARNVVLTGIVILVILMLVAAFGFIPALLGAIFQEVVDTATILLALLAKTAPRKKKETSTAKNNLANA